MGKIQYALNFLAQRRMKLAEMMTPEEQQITLTKLTREIDEELQAKALTECIMSRYRAHFNKLLDEGDADDILPLMKDINDEKKKKDEETTKSDYVFITVNPKSTVPLNEFQKLVNKSVEKSFIKKSLHVIEQRGENMDELGKGFHAHILINKGDYRLSHLRREFARTFNKVCDTDLHQCFNIQICKKSDLKKRQNYMIGVKDDEAKHKKQLMDKEFRKKFLIRDYYGELFDVDIGELL